MQKLELSELEQLTINHWPALNSIKYNGWILRFSSGYTKRANSIQALQHTSEDIASKIAYCEKQYEEHNLPVIFKITPFSNPIDLDQHLARSRYKIVDPSLVLSIQLDQLHLSKQLNMEGVLVDQNMWLQQLCSIQPNLHPHLPILEQIISNITAPKVFVSLLQEEKVIGCGFGVIEREYMGLYDIYIAKEFRRMGYGEKLLYSLLSNGNKLGAKYSYLQVVQQNEAALSLYQKLGYQKQYEYWYRVKT